MWRNRRGLHERKGSTPLLGVWPEVDDAPDDREEIICRECLGGVFKHDERKAA